MGLVPENAGELDEVVVVTEEVTEVTQSQGMMGRCSRVVQILTMVRAQAQSLQVPQACDAATHLKPRDDSVITVLGAHTKELPDLS